MGKKLKDWMDGFPCARGGSCRESSVKSRKCFCIAVNIQAGGSAVFVCTIT